MLDQIKDSLNQNPDLTDEVRQNIFELAVIFNQHFPEIRLKTLNDRLKKVKITRISRFVQNEVVAYNPLDNTITFNLGELNKNHDINHLLMYVLLQMITANGCNTGFDQNKQYEALNLGYTEILANFLVGNESDIFYHENEAIEANLIGIIVGADKMQEAYFYNKPSAIIKALKEVGIE